MDDSRMIGYHFNFENDGGGDAVAAEREAALVDLVERTFSKKGNLVKTLKLEHRPQQAEMSEAVLQAMLEKAPILFEAGTGVGKSLAYLIPGILHAISHKQQCLISTHTINLQEQIFQKDLELCRTLFQQCSDYKAFADFRKHLLLGRHNYLCGTRLRQAFREHATLFSSNVQSELERIAAWAKTSAQGIIHELNPAPMPEVWEWISADGHSCNARNCTPETCFYRKAREQVSAAHVLIINHSLLCSLVSAGYGPGPDKPGILHPNDFLVIDEAHTLLDVATEHFGAHISSFGIRKQLHRLYNPLTQKGLLQAKLDLVKRSRIQKAFEVVEQFFSGIEFNFLQEKSIVRLSATDWADPVYKGPLQDVCALLKEQSDLQPDGAFRDEVNGCLKYFQTQIQGLDDCLKCGDEDAVYWVERTGRRGQNVTLRSAPLSVAPDLNSYFFQRNTSVVLTSATLDDGSGEDRIKTRMGASHAVFHKVSSPFDYESQMQVCIASDAPDPGNRGIALDVQWLADTIYFCADRVKGGTLVLWTSYRDMHATGEMLRLKWAGKERPIWIQGQDGNRNWLKQAFQSAGNGILMGTDSFWTGIDIPGTALSQVIVTRLPFENPTHPVAEARCEWLQKQQKSAFQLMALPDAVMKFRQGIGRLIRKSDDRGIVTILDPRILTKPYGRQFLEILPVSKFQRFNVANRAQVFPVLL
jgi:ATP-dependent DNA helicase DinG